MEFVDGVTLREKIGSTQLSVNDVISYSIQIGEALEEAHAKGIVHRDIKPENIMLSSKNQIKVMDFGLAKLKGSMNLTRTSSTVGTLAYMAPEQIQGGAVDTRSDIFSFGVVLFEMLTGHYPFRGEHEAAMMYSIVNEEPAAIEKYRADIPPQLANAIARALEKDPSDRFQTDADLVSELKRAKKQPTGVVRGQLRSNVPPTSGPVKHQGSRPVSRRTVWTGMILLGLIGIVAGYLLLVPRRSAELNPAMRFQTLQLPFAEIGYPGISPDGKWAAFPAADAHRKWDIYFMNISGGEPRRITSDSSIHMESADVSPDGSMIIFDRNENTQYPSTRICIVSSLGGPSKVLAEDGSYPRWRPDGRRIGYLHIERRGNEYRSTGPDGSDDRVEFVDSGSSGGRISFSYSPAGTSIAFIRNFPRSGNQEVCVHDLTTGKERQLTNDQKNIDEVCWAPNGQIIYSTNRGGNYNLWMVPVSGGEPAQVTRGSGPDMGIKISADGKKMLYFQRQDIGHLWIANLKIGTARPITSDEVSITGPALSPDNKRIAFVMLESDPSGSGSHIFVCDRDGVDRRQMSFGEENAWLPLWSPDGRWIVYSAVSIKEPNDSARIYLLDPSNAHAPKMVGRGYPSKWIDSGAFITTLSGRSSITFTDGRPPKHLPEGISVGLLSDKGFTFRKKEGTGGDVLWYVPVNILSVADSPEIVSSSAVRYGRYPKDWFNGWKLLGSSQDARQQVALDVKSGALWRFTFPEGRIERISGKYPGLADAFIFYGISYNGKEIVYVDNEVKGNLIVIENLFK